MVTYNTGDDLFGVTSYIVDQTLGQGNYQDIPSAIAAGVSNGFQGDILIRPGTYVENLSLSAGINLVAWNADAQTPTVTISGTITATYTGTVTITGINLTNNGNNNIVNISGANATILNIFNCNITNNGISQVIFQDSSNASSVLNVEYCTGVNSNGTRFISNGSSGVANVAYCNFTSPINSILVTGAGFQTTVSHSNLVGSVTSSGTGNLTIQHCTIDNSAGSAPAIAHSATGAASTVAYCLLKSGSVAAVTIGTGATLTLTQCEVSSSNSTAVISGSGTLNYSSINFSGTGQKITVTTRNPLNSGTWTPTIVGASTAGTTTYSIQSGFYEFISSNLVWVNCNVSASAATGTGNVTIGGLPFLAKNLANSNSWGGGMLFNGTAATFPAGTTFANYFISGNTQVVLVECGGSGASSSNLQMANTALNFQFSMIYQI